MAFTRTAEYALRAVSELARSPDVLNSDDLSLRTQVPRPYLMKVLQQMQDAGLVESTRGKMGGWRLAPGIAATMTMYDVMQAVDPIERVRVCPLHLPEHKDKLCPMHAALDAVFAKMETEFKAARVTDLVDKTVTPESLLAALASVRCTRKPARGRTPKA